MVVAAAAPFVSEVAMVVTRAAKLNAQPNRSVRSRTCIDRRKDRSLLLALRRGRSNHLAPLLAIDALKDLDHLFGFDLVRGVDVSSSRRRSVVLSSSSLSKDFATRRETVTRGVGPLVPLWNANNGCEFRFDANPTNDCTEVVSTDPASARAQATESRERTPFDVARLRSFLLLLVFCCREDAAHGRERDRWFVTQLRSSSDGTGLGSR